MHWTWLLTLTVRAGQATPYKAWLRWHYHVLLPATTRVPS